MSRRLPPLNALRVFESAGRHVSFTRAADELHVTPGAVSRQIKFLEETLGIELFERTSRELRINAECLAYASALTAAFERIEHATENLLNTNKTRPLRIHSAMTFTLKWLVPRLPLFHNAHSDREIQLTTSLNILPVSRLESGEIDVAVHIGKGDWPGTISHRLASSALLPVCRPQHLEGTPPLRTVSDLSKHTLLHSIARPDDWSHWVQGAGADNVDPERGLHFESSSLALQAAKEGLGVAIGQLALVIDDIEIGSLVAPFDFVLDSGDAYYLTYLEGAAAKPQLVEFRNWILEEAEKYESKHKATLAQLLSNRHGT